MATRGFSFLALGGAGALAVACLDIAPAEPAPGSGGSAGSGAGGAAGWPGSGGASAAGGATGGASGAGAGGTAGTGGAGMGGTGGTGATGGAGGTGGSSSFAVRGVVFDGVNDWLDSVTSFQGAFDTKTVTGSLWLKRTGLNKVQCLGPEGAGSNAPNQLELTQANSFRVVWRKAGGGTACDLMSSPITDTTSWHHVVFSVDVSDQTKRHLYLDGTSSLFVSFYDNTLLDNTGSQWGLFADNGGNSKYDGEVAEFWLAMGVYVDLSLESNRARFRSNGGKPVDLGQSGETPTGAPPTIYLSLRPGQTASAFAQNRGSGGGFQVHGALELSATSPSD